MKVQTILYYRYLLRQTITMVITTLLIAATISFITLFSPIGLQEKIRLIITITIWVLPLYTITILLIWTFKFLQSKKQLKNLQLYSKITNQAVRESVVKSKTRIKCLFISKNQEQQFFNIISHEIEKQRQLLNLQKGQK